MKEKVIILSHCILNSFSKVKGKHRYENAGKTIVEFLIKNNIGIIQMPCPETLHYGIKRWGHVKEQFDNPYYRKTCNKLIEDIISQIKDYEASDYEIIGLVGIDGSPSCGVNITCGGNYGGELEDLFKDEKPKAYVLNESGVFIEEIRKSLEKEDIKLNIIGFNENNPIQLIKILEKLI